MAQVQCTPGKENYTCSWDGGKVSAFSILIEKIVVLHIRKFQATMEGVNKDGNLTCILPTCGSQVEWISRTYTVEEKCPDPTTSSSVVGNTTFTESAGIITERSPIPTTTNETGMDWNETAENARGWREEEIVLSEWKGMITMGISFSMVGYGLLACGCLFFIVGICSLIIGFVTKIREKQREVRMNPFGHSDASLRLLRNYEEPPIKILSAEGEVNYCQSQSSDQIKLKKERSSALLRGSEMEKKRLPRIEFTETGRFCFTDLPPSRHRQSLHLELFGFCNSLKIH